MSAADEPVADDGAKLAETEIPTRRPAAGRSPHRARLDARTPEQVDRGAERNPREDQAVHGDYRHGEALFNPARFRPYRRQPGDPLFRRLRIYTRDPITSRYKGATSTVAVRYEPLLPGPEGKLLLVADQEYAGRDANDDPRYHSYPGVDLDDRAALINQGRDPSPGDIFFHQQMVYVVASKVVERFTLALGRDPSWGFNHADRDADHPAGAARGDQLRLLPHYNSEANACYDPIAGELRFGSFRARADAEPGEDGALLPSGTIYGCLSQDIIAHEMAHALLHGMRRKFTEPTNPDVLAFHEAFADLIAILNHCQTPEAMKRALVEGGGKLVPADLFKLAEQFGRATGAGGALRVADIDTKALYHRDDEHQPHKRGLVLATAILDAMEDVFERRTAKLKRLYALAELPEKVSLDSEYVELLAEMATAIAGQFMYLIIRAVDYCPPVDLTFGEFLRALITADRNLVEDDPYDYRGALIAAFGRRRIFPADVRDLSEGSLCWREPSRPLPAVPELSMANIRYNGEPGTSVTVDEIETQATALADLVTDPRYAAEFGLVVGEARAALIRANAAVSLPVIESIRTLRRVGPDRQVRFGVVAEVLQVAELEHARAPITMIGGATIVFNARGEVQFVIRKRLDNTDRARRQANYQAQGVGRFQARAAASGNLWTKLHDERTR